MQKNNIKFNCRYFNGGKPCGFKIVCRGCHFYSPIKKKILIIKLASAGDVLRTTVLLPILRKKYPRSHISWLVRDPAQELLDSSPYLDRILVFSLESVLSLLAEKFDLVISLDKAIEAVSLATLVKANKKYGFGLDENGKVYPFNKDAEYSFILGLDDDLKFYKNKKTYQEMIFEITKLRYVNQRYELRLAKREFDFADRFFRNNGLHKEDIIIGINTGAGKVFANKNLRPNRLIELIRLLNKEIDVKILLLGGPLEKEINRYILKRMNSRVINGGCGNSLKEFAALINRCALIITADTLSLHIAVALKRPVVALFGPTAHQEIELYGCGRKIISDLGCTPCYKNKCDKAVTCMDKIRLEKVVDAVQDLIGDKILKR